MQGLNFIFFIFLVSLPYISGHGRFMKPVSRSSIWRVPEFQDRNPPINNNDNQLYCGGKHQEEIVGGECGVCGDPWEQPKPRENEIGGAYYRGIITGNYRPGQVIDVEVELTASHKGFMEFRLCKDPIGTNESQDCFNEHVLQLADGSGTKIYPGPDGWYKSQFRLPNGVTCNHCVIQWNYRAGNGWGECEDGSHQTGCGPQETFRGCSDVQIS